MGDPKAISPRFLGESSARPSHHSTSCGAAALTSTKRTSAPVTPRAPNATNSAILAVACSAGISQAIVGNVSNGPCYARQFENSSGPPKGKWTLRIAHDLMACLGYLLQLMTFVWKILSCSAFLSFRRKATRNPKPHIIIENVRPRVSLSPAWVKPNLDPESFTTIILKANFPGVAPRTE